MIDFDDVFVLYRGAVHDVVALRGLNLSVSRGERVVVQGPSGSGKSTLIKVVTSQVAPSAGRVMIMGRVVDTTSVRSVRRADERVGVVTQGTGRDLVPELSCAENVALQARLDGANRATATAAARSLLRRFDLEHLADRRPGTLSNGEAQRVGLAAALAAEPSVIVADEPTGELDRVSADGVYDLLSEQIRATGASLLLVTHDTRAARIADRIITIRDGRVSNEHADGHDLLIVDPRGWVRLPQAERATAGISDRVIAAGDDRAMSLRRPGPEFATGGMPTADPGPLPHTGLAGPAGTATPTEGSDTEVVPLVEGRDVSFRIDGTTVLEPCSFIVQRGALCAVTGRSGSGKTTMLSILAGLVEPTGGTVDRFAGMTVAVSASVAGFAEQLTVRQNLAVACEVRRVVDDLGDAILSLLGVGNLAHRIIGTLSGGERQRVSVARALVTGADLVLLDEPTSQLDEASAAVVSEALASLARSGRTIVCTTHDPELERVADAVIRLGATEP